MKQYNFKTNNLILCGDSHSLKVLFQLLWKLPDDCDAYSLGDQGIGFGFKPDAIEDALHWLNLYNNFCASKHINLYLSLGNHDAPYTEIWDTTWSNVFMTKTGDVGVFPNRKKALLVGGGISVDRCQRTEGVDYWREEVTPELVVDGKYDIVLSHDCPEEFNLSTNSLHKRFDWAIKKDPTLIEDCLKQRKNMSRIVRESGATTILHGHYHNAMRARNNGVYCRCLDIEELYELDTDRLDTL